MNIFRSNTWVWEILTNGQEEQNILCIFVILQKLKNPNWKRMGRKKRGEGEKRERAITERMKTAIPPSRPMPIHPSSRPPPSLPSFSSLISSLSFLISSLLLPPSTLRSLPPPPSLPSLFCRNRSSVFVPSFLPSCYYNISSSSSLPSIHFLSLPFGIPTFADSGFQLFWKSPHLLCFKNHFLNQFLSKIMFLGKISAPKTFFFNIQITKRNFTQHSLFFFFILAFKKIKIIRRFGLKFLVVWSEWSNQRCELKEKKEWWKEQMKRPADYYNFEISV